MTERYLDLDAWPRRPAFDYYLGFDKPYFNVCVRLDAARLKAVAAERSAALGQGTFTLAYHFITLRLANLHEPFRWRIRGDRVRVHDEVHGSATVLRDDESFGFALLRHDAHYSRYVALATAELRRVVGREGSFAPMDEGDALLHFTTLPQVAFTSFSHARNWGREDSVPKFAFGRALPEDAREGGHLWLPFSVEVHHALMDGLHVGRFVQAMEAAFAEPERWLSD